MGDVTALHIPRPRVMTHAPDRGAEILFFTGVRYERTSEVPASCDPPDSRDPPDEPRGAGEVGRRRRGSGEAATR